MSCKVTALPAQASPIHSGELYLHPSPSGLLVLVGQLSVTGGHRHCQEWKNKCSKLISSRNLFSDSLEVLTHPSPGDFSSQFTGKTRHLCWEFRIHLHPHSVPTSIPFLWAFSHNWSSFGPLETHTPCPPPKLGKEWQSPTQQAHSAMLPFSNIIFLPNQGDGGLSKICLKIYVILSFPKPP